MARSITSLDMLCALAAMMAALRRGLCAGSGMPSLAETVISRDSLENSLDFCASCRFFRNMMFLNWEWPAMARFQAWSEGQIAGLLGPFKSTLCSRKCVGIHAQTAIGAALVQPFRMSALAACAEGDKQRHEMVVRRVRECGIGCALAIVDE